MFSWNRILPYGPKPFLKKSPKNSEYSLALIPILKKKSIKFYHKTEIQCFNALRAQHSDLDVAGRETLHPPEWQHMVFFHPWRGLCPLCSQQGGNCCCCSPSAHTHQHFKRRFCDLATPWPLGDQKMTVRATAKSLWAISLYLLPSCPHFQAFLSPCLSLISLQHTTLTITSWHCRCRQEMHHLPRVVTYCKKFLPANPGHDPQHSGNSTSLRHHTERVQQKIFSGRSSQSQPLKLADAEQPFCTLTQECITPKGQPNQAALWTQNKNSFNENFVPGQTKGHVIVCLKLCIPLRRFMELFWSLNLSEDPIVF